MKKAEKLVLGIFVLSLVMVNPPILNLINQFAKGRPLLGGYPTLWLWLQLWYIIPIAAFLIAAIALPSWKKEKDGEIL